MKIRKIPTELAIEVEDVVFKLKVPDHVDMLEYSLLAPPEILKLTDEDRKKISEGDTEARKRIFNPASLEYMRAKRRFVCSRVVSVTGITYDDGTPVPVESLDKDCPSVVMDKVIEAYGVAVYSTQAGVAEEKKTETPTDHPIN